MNGSVLVAGASGVVGHAAVRHFVAEGWDVIALSRRRPLGFEDLNRVTFLPVDLTDATACSSLAGHLGRVTHVVYAALFEKPGLVAGWRSRDQMETNLCMFRNLIGPLSSSERTRLRHVSLLQGTKAYGVHIERVPVPARERSPRHRHENFYFLQEDDLRARAADAGGRWSWTILRPQIVFGESIGSHMNLIPAIGVYGAVLRERRLPLSFPGGADHVLEAVDADLLGRALVWAATSDAAKGEIFNVTNGDVFEWRAVWPAIAAALGMEPGPDVPLSLAEEMPRRAAEWAGIVTRHGLVAPAGIEAFVGQSFVYADRIFRFGVEEIGVPQLVSTIKIRQAGFADCMDTEDMFRKWFAVLQRRRLLPSPAPGSGRAGGA